MRNKSIEIVTELAGNGGQPGEHLETLARQLRYMTATREAFAVDEAADIHVTTLWGAKGVTADHVYVLGLCDEAIPGEMRDTYPGTTGEYIDEQRRLFYVTITRTRDTLVLSRALTARRSEALQLGLDVKSNNFMVSLTACRFLREIQQFLPLAVPGDSWEWPC